MPDLPVSEAQLERLEELSDELEAIHVGEYGTVRPRDALEYLLDACPPPAAEADDPGSSLESGADLDALTAIDGVGEATAESLVDSGFPTVERVADADPSAIAEIDGIGDTQAVDIVASATELGDETSDEGADDGSSQPSEAASPGPSNGGSDSPEDTLQEAMSLLDAHDDRWRESSGDEPYEVDLPDGSTEAVRTKDDIKRLIFKHWR
jgi:predicted flap endonuclease-1-like 5' DNA nuclease